MDEVRLYDRALPDEELLIQHENPATEGLTHHVSFNDQERPNHKAVGQPRSVRGKDGAGIELDGSKQWLELLNKRELRGGWSISLWFKGVGPLFGRPGVYSFDTNSVWHLGNSDDNREGWNRQSLGAAADHRFWVHLSASFDPQTKTIKTYMHDQEVRDWYRENVRWNYMQVRLRWPKAQRFQTGVMAWHYGNYGKLRGITTFGYDWNNRTCVVVPKNGDRFQNDGIWYRTIGWEGCREGIDDARYLQTLVNAMMRKGLSKGAAIKRVSEIIAPVNGQWGRMKLVEEKFGTYANLRGRIIEEILKHHQPERKNATD
jgi:hypothetical protein